jgi:hypothetical protein
MQAWNSAMHCQWPGEHRVLPASVPLRVVQVGADIQRAQDRLERWRGPEQLAGLDFVGRQPLHSGEQLPRKRLGAGSSIRGTQLGTDAREMKDCWQRDLELGEDKAGTSDQPGCPVDVRRTQLWIGAGDH